MNDEVIKPDIYNYLDYRKFLDDIYKYYKSVNRHFSYRFIAKKTGASSAGWFPNIVKGRINLTSIYVGKLNKLLKLNVEEQEYFELLVAYNQSGSHEEKSIFFNKLKSLQYIQPALIHKEHLAYLTKWYISAVRELLLIFPFKDDCKSLSEIITPQLDETEVREALDVLKKIGLVRADKSGYIKPCDSIIMKDPTVKTSLWKTYMESKINLGKDSINLFNKEERDISEVYMPLSKSGFEQACKEIAILRKKLLVISENDSDPDRVYQCSVQMFPLSRSVKKQN
ncbi:TIGR02147 family protein [Chitinispirillales bacterium ANBcel5]|uniref:TIGR02147 family protein n=1 Tax=Cellulosispirillum alkaliphilum TaxID=3039283 RepID=UPI002A52E991|nr:TIGR02147 family protein [Chitinispirillales bacterium ANBcel5]